MMKEYNVICHHYFSYAFVSCILKHETKCFVFIVTFSIVIINISFVKHKLFLFFIG